MRPEVNTTSYLQIQRVVDSCSIIVPIASRINRTESRPSVVGVHVITPQGVGSESMALHFHYKLKDEDRLQTFSVQTQLCRTSSAGFTTVK